MPLTEKGQSILKSMEKEYGSRAKEVLYASKNSGKITGIDSFDPRAACDDVDVEAAMDSLRNDAKLDAALSGASILDNRASMVCDDHRVIGGVNFTPPSGGGRGDAIPLAQAEAEFSTADRERDEMKEKVRAALRTGMKLSDIEAKYGAQQKDIERRYKAASNAVVASRDKYGWPAERR